MTDLQPRLIRLHPADNVAVALEDLAPGRPFGGFGIAARTEARRGHKVALADLAERMPVMRYGQMIGVATVPIPAGTRVHGQNLGMGDHRQDYAFTTGRCSVSGYKPVPCIKLATNSEMHARMTEDMDINCGDIVTDGVSVEQKGREIFELFLRVASGERTKSDELGFGGAEFVPWQIGAVM